MAQEEIVASLADDDMFVDSSFPPEETSLYKDAASPPDYAVQAPAEEGKGGEGKAGEGAAVRWQRPTSRREGGDGNSWLSDPELLVDDLARLGVTQGGMDDRWFLGALAAVAAHPAGLLENLFVADEQWTTHGVITCRFFQDGEWVEVVVDTLLPVGAQGDPLYGHCTDSGQYWAQIIEKAYAKLHGRCVTCSLFLFYK